MKQAPNDSSAASHAPSPVEPVVSGSKEFRYQYEPARLALPPGVRMKNGHGLCLDKQGRIYFTFESEKVEPQTRALVRFSPDGTEAELLGEGNFLALGVPHGLSIQTDPDGSEVLYHANNDRAIHKTTLSGELLWSQSWGPQMGIYKPTQTVALPGGGPLIVADGYGSSMIHCLSAVDGVYAGKSWGGRGLAHGELNCPHGIAFDPRRNLLLICDRGNKRLEYYTTNGVYQDTVQVKELPAPCNVDFQGDFVLVPDLDGSVVILDKDNKAVSVIEVEKLLGSLGFRHPHDAIWLENGDIVVCTWNPGRIGYWRRL